MIDLLASLVGNGTAGGFYDPHFAFYNAEMVLIPLLAWALVSWFLLWWGVVGQWAILARVGFSVGLGINIAFFSTWFGLLGSSWASPFDVMILFAVLTSFFIPVIFFLTDHPRPLKTTDKDQARRSSLNG